MSGIDITKQFKYWKNFFGVLDEEFNLIKKNFIEINLKTGDNFYDFNELPKGIILINQGILRLVGKNSNNELLSIDKFKEDEIASAITILLGQKNTSLVASNNVRGFFLEKELFIKFLENENF